MTAILIDPASIRDFAERIIKEADRSIATNGVGGSNYEIAQANAARQLLVLLDKQPAAQPLALDADDVVRLRATREEMARFNFLPEVPGLIATLDKVLKATESRS